MNQSINEQLNENYLTNDLVFDDLIFDSNTNQSMSPLVMNLSLKRAFNPLNNNSYETIIYLQLKRIQNSIKI
jgi:hypothetical protein